MAIGSLVS